MQVTFVSFTNADAPSSLLLLRRSNTAPRGAGSGYLGNCAQFEFPAVQDIETVSIFEERKRFVPDIECVVPPRLGHQSDARSPVASRRSTRHRSLTSATRYGDGGGVGGMDVHPATGLGTPDGMRPIGTLGKAPLPRTPAVGEGVETTPLHGTPAHVPGLTPELRASLPSGSLATWSAEEVSRCLRVLGRDFSRDEGDATDVSIFDTAAMTCQLDGIQLAAVTGDALRAMGFVRYEHRAAIMDWVRHRLEVRPGVFPLPVHKTRFGIQTTTHSRH